MTEATSAMAKAFSHSGSMAPGIAVGHAAKSPSREAAHITYIGIENHFPRCERHFPVKTGFPRRALDCASRVFLSASRMVHTIKTAGRHDTLRGQPAGASTSDRTQKGRPTGNRGLCRRPASNGGRPINMRWSRWFRCTPRHGKPELRPRWVHFTSTRASSTYTLQVGRIGPRVLRSPVLQALFNRPD
jgi:hypothetical protein